MSAVASQLITYDARTKRVGIAFWSPDKDKHTILSQTAWLTLDEAAYLLAELNKTLASIPPEPRTVSAEDLGL